MKKKNPKLIFAVFFSVSLSTISVSQAMDIKELAYAVEQTFDKKLFKDPNYIQGQSFPLGDKGDTGYFLYFEGLYEGINSIVKVNCSVDAADNIKSCKPVRVTPNQR